MDDEEPEVTSFQLTDKMLDRRSFVLTKINQDTSGIDITRYL